MSKAPKILAVTLALAVAACSGAAGNLVRDLAGAICPIVVQAADPKLGPGLCSTLTELDQVRGELIAAHAKAAPPGVSSTPYEPSQDDLYRAIEQRHAGQ